MPRGFRKASVLAWPVLLAICGPTANAQTSRKVSFSKDVAPLLTQRCMECHGREPLMANLDLRTRTEALKGAKHGR